MRLRQLDILRAGAILLVLGAHAPPGIRELPEPTSSLFKMWQKGGWSGVDLFFVLSGFLVSGLLFREYKSSGRIDPTRFLVRRGFKIYPPFYTLFILTLTVRWLTSEPTGIWAGLAEGVFLQNYHVGLWGYTWTLAVEEHFYLIIGIGLATLVRYYPEKPFRPLVVAFVVVPFVVLGLRILTAVTLPFQHKTHHWPTHLRIDSLLFGTMLAYVHCFRPEVFARLVRWRWPILLVSLGCLIPPWVLPASDVFMHTIGYSLLALGFGGLLVFSLGQPQAKSWVAGALVTLLMLVGTHSYSIYLWHGPMAGWVMPLLRTWINLGDGFLFNLILYMLGACVLGIVMAKLVEFPFLHLRDRYFPARSRTSGLPATEQEKARPLLSGEMETTFGSLSCAPISK
jgi:peptidoglycan/LPS O-acetylase OafA/YrhL